MAASGVSKDCGFCWIGPDNPSDTRLVAMVLNRMNECRIFMVTSCLRSDYRHCYGRCPSEQPAAQARMDVPRQESVAAAGVLLVWELEVLAALVLASQPAAAVRDHVVKTAPDWIDLDPGSSIHDRCAISRPRRSRHSRKRRDRGLDYSERVRAHRRDHSARSVSVHWTEPTSVQG